MECYFKIWASFLDNYTALLSQNDTTQAKLILQYDRFYKTTLRTH